MGGHRPPQDTHRRDRPPGRRPFPRPVLDAGRRASQRERRLSRDRAPTRLVFSWAWQSTPERESQVTIDLKRDNDGTILTLTHEQFFDEKARDGHRGGWGMALDRLEELFA